MNVKALQQTDQWFGVPLCWVLTFIRALCERRVARQTAVRRMLFVKLAEQGSTVLAYPALRRAVEVVGRENVYFVAFEDNRFILDALDVIPRENVVTVSVASVPAFVASMFAAIRRLRRLKLDAAADLEFFSRGSAVLAFLSGARRRAGFHAGAGPGPYRGDLMTHRLIYNPRLHTTQTFLAVVDSLLSDAPGSTSTDALPPGSLEVPAFVGTADEIAAVEAKIDRLALRCGPLVLLNPNASDLLPLRRWSGDRYVELAERLLERHGDILVVFTGGPNEAAATGELARRVRSRRCISLAGQTTLRQLLVLYTISDVLVTNDSGPAHFATLTPIHVVTLFGPETPDLFAAPTPRNTVLWARLPCSPCVNAYNNRISHCPENCCMRAITVDQVFIAVCNALVKRSRREHATNPHEVREPVCS